MRIHRLAAPASALASCVLFATACRGTGGPPPGHPARADTASSGSVAPEEARLWPDAPEAAPGAPVLFTCPMHPEVVRDVPGSCPICKMDLEPMEGER